MLDTIGGRYREQVRDEVKAAALRQLADGGPQALSVNAIAKELGVSGPALYRYFAGRDELLTELIIDAYRDFALALRPCTSLAAMITAYRAWALALPHRYRLLFTAPLPGYDAHAPALVEASKEAMEILVAVLSAADTIDVAAPFRDELTTWAPTVDPGVAAAALTKWARVHGLVSLEIEGNYASMGLDPTPLYNNL